MKIDLHVHTAERSPCARSPEARLIARAHACGLDALAFTDHNRFTSPEHLAQLNAEHAPLRIFSGIEISLYTENEHILVLGLYDPALEREDWTYPHLHAFVRARGGFLALAHPYRYRPYIGLDLERYPPDAIEGHSLNTPVHAAAQIAQLAEWLGLSVLSNSDAHTSRVLGKYYNLLPRAPHDEGDLLALLRSGTSRPCFPPREVGLEIC